MDNGTANETNTDITMDENDEKNSLLPNESFDVESEKIETQEPQESKEGQIQGSFKTIYKPKEIQYLRDAVRFEGEQFSVFIKKGDRVILEYSDAIWRETILAKVKEISSSGNIWLIDESIDCERITSITALKSKKHQLKILGNHTRSSLGKLAHSKKLQQISMESKHMENLNDLSTASVTSDFVSQDEGEIVERSEFVSPVLSVASDFAVFTGTDTQATEAAASSSSTVVRRAGRPVGAINEATRAKLVSAGHQLEGLSSAQISALAKSLRKATTPGTSTGHRGRPAGALATKTIKAMEAAGYSNVSSLPPGERAQLAAKLRAEKKI